MPSSPASVPEHRRSRIRDEFFPKALIDSRPDLRAGPADGGRRRVQEPGAAADAGAAGRADPDSAAAIAPGRQRPIRLQRKDLGVRHGKTCSGLDHRRRPVRRPAGRAGHGRDAENRHRPARQLGEFAGPAGPGGRHLQEARARARDPVHPGRRRDVCRRCCRAASTSRIGVGIAGRDDRLLQGRAGADDRQLDHRRQRPVLVRAGGFADQGDGRCRRAQHRLLDQRVVDQRHGAGPDEDPSALWRRLWRPAALPRPSPR